MRAVPSPAPRHQRCPTTTGPGAQRHGERAAGQAAPAICGEMGITIRSALNHALPGSGKQMGTGTYAAKTWGLRPPKSATISPEHVVGPTRIWACAASSKLTIPVKSQKSSSAELTGRKAPRWKPITCRGSKAGLGLAGNRASTPVIKRGEACLWRDHSQRSETSPSPRADPRGGPTVTALSP